MNNIKLIVGLGNPGTKYAKSRHNAGFMALDELQKTLGFEDFREEKKFNSYVSIGDFKGKKLILLKPFTFMNLSGNAVKRVANFHKIPAGDCFIIYDDIDTIFGHIRIRKKGGPGTHNGMKSIIEAMGENIPRLRIGIENRTPDIIEQQDITAYVLASFKQKESMILKKTLFMAIEAVQSALQGGIEKAMTVYNT